MSTLMTRDARHRYTEQYPTPLDETACKMACCDSGRRHRHLRLVSLIVVSKSFPQLQPALVAGYACFIDGAPACLPRLHLSL